MTAEAGPYRPRAAPPGLADLIVCRWDATMSGLISMVPDGCVEVMWLEGRGLVVCGPETQAWSAEHARPVQASGVRLRPGVARQVLGLPVGELRDQRVALVDLLPRDVTERTEEHLLAADADLRSDALVTLVRDLSDGSRPGPGLPRLTRAIESADGMSALADEVGFSTRQLHRRSLDLFGYGPATLRRILRVQRFLALHRRTPAESMARLAAAARYYDQPHLVRDVRELTGLTPTELLASDSASWHGEGEVVEV